LTTTAVQPRMVWRRRAGRILLWASTIAIALGIGLAGLAKFLQADRWRLLFDGWGYPTGLSTIVGIAELAGAIGLLVPALAFYAAMLLATVMTGALLTLLRHPGGQFGWGATPAVYIVLLSFVAVARWRQRAGPAARRLSE
jgi:uncharacterized membrane protein YphA (DoxX/SURF4 family)